MATEISLTFTETADIDEGSVRIDPLDMRLLGVQAGEYVLVSGEQVSCVRVRAATMEERNQRLACGSRALAENLGLADGGKIRFQEGTQRVETADKLTIEVEDDLDALFLQARMHEIAPMLHGRAFLSGDKVALPGLEKYPLVFKVVETGSRMPVFLGSATEVKLECRRSGDDLPPLAGLRDAYLTCRDIASARVRDLSSLTASSVLLSGYTGSGRSQLVARLAADLGVQLVVLDVNQLIDRAVVYGLSEIELSLTTLARKPEVLILVDQLDALSEGLTKNGSSIASAARCVEAQLCALMDEVRLNKKALIFAIASGSVDKRFSEQQRFDLHMAIDAPNRFARAETLALALRGIAVDESVDCFSLSIMTEGATSRDLFQLARSASLLARGARVGEADFIAAYRTMSPSVANEICCDVPTTLWDDVAGLDDIKRLLGETLVWSVRHHEKFSAAGVRPPRSILLSGGQGTGKTSLIRALARSMPLNYIEIKCPLLASYSVEDAVRRIADTFALARRKAPCLIFFDDIEVLFEIAGPLAAVAPHLHPIVAQVLAELEALARIYGVIVVAATNRPDRLSPEMLRQGRFDFAVTLPMPDVAARKKIFEIHAHKLPLAADVDFDRLAASTQGMSPADIANLCSRVGLMALRQSLNSGDAASVPPVVNAELFEQSLRGRKA